MVCSDTLFDKLVETILAGVETPGSDLVSLIQTIGTISRTVGYRMGRFLERLVPLFIGFCGSSNPEDNEDEDEKANELREYSFPGLESFVVYCPREISSKSEELMHLGLSFMCYDPNYQYDEEDDEEMEVDEYSDEDYGSDDDDSSWKVRKAAVRLISAIISSRADALYVLYDELVDGLISRFKEREENVRLDIISAFTNLVSTTQDPSKISESERYGLERGFPNLSKMKVNGGLERQNSQESRLQSKIPSLLKAIYKQLASSSIKTKSAVFVLLQTLVKTLPGTFYNDLSGLFDLSYKSLDEKNQTLKLDALYFMRLAIENHQYQIMESPSLVKSIIPKIIPSVNEDWYKIIAEALRVIGTVIIVIRSEDSLKEKIIDTELKGLTSSLYNSIVPRLEALDIDQEIKDCAIHVSGQLVAYLGDHLEKAETENILNILKLRLDNEVTRISSLRSMIFISQSPLQIDLSSILADVLTNVAMFLKQQSRLLKQTCLKTLNAILISSSSSSKDFFSEALMNPILKELASLINDSDLSLAKDALKVSVVVFNCFPESAKSINEIIFPKATQLAFSPLLQGSCQQALIDFFQTFVVHKVEGMSFEDTLKSLTSQSLQDLPRQSIINLAKCIAGICLKSDAKSRDKSVKKFSKDIQEGDHAEKHLALLCLGELGQQLDISTSSDLKDLILSCFGGEQEDIKMAGAFALGHLAVGNVSLYLPTVLHSVDTTTQHPHQYFLLVALKEMIMVYANLNLQFLEYIDHVLPGLIVHCKSEEEGVRSMVSECIGALLIMHGDKIIEPLLNVLENLEDKFSRRSISTSIRHFLSRHAQKVDCSLSIQDVLTSSRMDSLLSLLSDSDLEVQRSALLMVNAAIRHQADLIRGKLRESVVPILFNIMQFKQERVVDLGPFKHKVDDGLPLRKAALVSIESIIDVVPGYLDINHFISKLVPRLSDKDEIKMQSHQILSKICSYAPSSLVGSLDLFIDPLLKTISKNPSKDGQAGPEIERAIDLIRSGVKVVVLINKIQEANVNRNWVDFVEKVKANDNVNTMFNEIEKDDSNSSF